MTDEEHRLAFRDGLDAAWDAVNAIIQEGLLPLGAHLQRNGIVLASNEISKLIVRMHEKVL